MAWALPYLYIQLLHYVRGATEIAGVTLETSDFFGRLFSPLFHWHRSASFCSSIAWSRDKVNWRSPSALPSHK